MAGPKLRKSIPLGRLEVRKILHLRAAHPQVPLLWKNPPWLRVGSYQLFLVKKVHANRSPLLAKTLESWCKALNRLMAIFFVPKWRSTMKLYCEMFIGPKSCVSIDGLMKLLIRNFWEAIWKHLSPSSKILIDLEKLSARGYSHYGLTGGPARVKEGQS